MSDITIKKGDFGHLKRLVEDGTIPAERKDDMTERVSKQDVILEQMTNVWSYVTLTEGEEKKEEE